MKVLKSLTVKLQFPTCEGLWLLNEFPVFSWLEVN